MSLDQVMQKYVNSSYDELLEIARENISVVFPVIKECSSDDSSAVNTMIGILSTVLASDGKLTDLEYRFFNDLLGISDDFDSVKSIVQACYDNASQESLNAIVDACNSDVRANLLSLCCAVMSIDEKISREEVELFKKLVV